MKSIFLGFARWRLWIVLAFNDIKMRYKKSWIGIGWLSLSMTLLLGAKLVVFGQFTAKSISFFSVYLATGLLVWRFIVGTVMDGSSVYLSAAGWIKTEPMPLTVYVFQMVFRNLVILLYSSIPVILVLLYFKSFSEQFFLLFIPVMLVYILNSVWIGIFLGIICTRYRDLAHLIQTLIQIMFFLTPVIWVASDLGKFEEYVKWNPFSHFLAIFRDPLLHEPIPILSWKVVIVITLVGWIAAIILHNRFRRNVVFWL